MNFMVKDKRPILRTGKRSLITALLFTTVAMMLACTTSCSSRDANSKSNANSPPKTGTGRLEGTVTDNTGNPIADLSVSIRNGPKAITDAKGIFVLNGVESGDQLIIVEPRSGHGQLTLNINIKRDQNPKTNIIYNADTSRLGLLSITSPVDDSLLEVRRNGNEHRATVHGRCDGLAQVLEGFDVWVLVKSERDPRYWIQRPSALIDPNSNTWRAGVLLGSPEHPPMTDESWDLIAVAAKADSDMGRILNTPNLNLLPNHITSNVVTVRLRITP